MARQAGPLFITGTIDDMVFYKMNGHYYMRLKGEPTPATKKRMQQDQYYPVLNMRKREFKAASQLVRAVYYTLPREVRKHGLFGKLTGKAVRLLRKGISEAVIQEGIIKEFGQVEPPIPVTAEEITTTVKATPPPSCTLPAQRGKAKRTTINKLSTWNVSEQGQLRQDTVKRKITTAKAASGAVMYNTQGYYSTCTFGSWG